MPFKRQMAPAGLAVLLAAVLVFSSLVPVQATGVTAANTDFSAASLAAQAPVITVWYENALNFGQIGTPQNQINILGNVSDPGGIVASLTYSLNNGAENRLSLGKSNVRLINTGDFNINLYTNTLNTGTYQLLIRAKDKNGAEVARQTVSFNYTAGRVWPMPYSTNWAAAANISEQAQVVDGLWNLNANGVTPVYFGYDRLIALGDLNWSQYEILVPVTVHGFYPDPGNPDDAGGIGIISRWTGHAIDPASPSQQPPTAWWNLGAYGYYSNRLGKLALRMDQNTVYTQTYPFTLNKTYMFKLRSETAAGTGRYSFKIWEAGTPEPSWSDPNFVNVVNKSDIAGDPQQGSVLLVAHRADATFGDVSVCPLSGSSYTLSTTINGAGSVTGAPNQGSVACGQSVTLTAQPQPGWNFVGWSGGILSTSPTISFNVIRNYNLTASFARAGQTLGDKLYIPLLGR